MKTTSSSILAIMAMLAVATFGVQAEQDAATSRPEAEEKGTWAPMMRALEATDDSLSTSTPVVDEKASWAPLRALAALPTWRPAEKASWAPLRALKTMDGDQIPTSQPVADEKASWAPLRALHSMGDAKQQQKQQYKQTHHSNGKPAAPKNGDKHH